MFQWDRRSWWRQPFSWVLIGFLALGGFLLLTEHGAHALGVLPLALLLACPMLHLFLHRGPHSHGSHRRAADDKLAETRRER